MFKNWYISKTAHRARREYFVFGRNWRTSLVRWLIPLLMLSAVCMVVNCTAPARYSYSTIKKCTRCYRQVPKSSRVGQHCPYCGALWVSEIGSTYREKPPKPLLPMPLIFTFVASRYPSTYLDKTGSMYGFEFGLDPDRDSQVYLMMRYRLFRKDLGYRSYSLSQHYIELGCRYEGFKIKSSFHPFLGGGIGWSIIHASYERPKSPWGIGLYLEGGAEYRFTDWLSFSGLLEYNLYQLKYHYDNGNSRSIGTESKLFPKAAINVFFNR